MSAVVSLTSCLQPSRKNLLCLKVCADYILTSRLCLPVHYKIGMLHLACPQRHMSYSVRDSEDHMLQRVMQAKKRFEAAKAKYKFSMDVDHIMQYYPRAVDMMHLGCLKNYFASKWFKTKELQKIDKPFTRPGFVQGTYAVDTSLLKALCSGNILLLDSMLTPSAYQEVCDNFDKLSEKTRTIINILAQKLSDKDYFLPHNQLRGFDYILEINIQKRPNAVTNVRIETMRPTALKSESNTVDHFFFSNLILEREYSSYNSGLWKVHKFAYMSLKDTQPGTPPNDYKNRYELHWF